MQQQQQRGAAPAALRRPRASPQPPPRPAHAAGARGRAARSAAASTSAPQQPAPPPAPPPPTAAAARWRRPAAGALAGLCATALLARAGPAFAAAASSAASAPLPGPASGPLYSAAWLLLQLLLVGAALRAGFAARAFVRARTADALAKFKAQWRGALFSAQPRARRATHRSPARCAAAPDSPARPNVPADAAQSRSWPPSWATSPTGSPCK